MPTITVDGASRESLGYQRTQVAVLGQGVGTAVTNSQTETTLATVVLPVLGKNDAIRITAVVTHTNSANNKTIKVKLNGTAVISITDTTTAALGINKTIRNKNSQSSQILFSNQTPADINATSVSPSTYSVDTSVAGSLIITGTCAALAETITLEHYTVELIPGS